MTPELKAQLDRILDYILETEATNYQECDEPENHIYALALEAKVSLTLI
jgi:hypothetical protein